MKLLPFVDLAGGLPDNGVAQSELAAAVLGVDIDTNSPNPAGGTYVGQGAQVQQAPAGLERKAEAVLFIEVSNVAVQPEKMQRNRGRALIAI